MTARTYGSGAEAYECRGRRDNGIDSCSLMPIPREKIDVMLLAEFTHKWHDLEGTRAALAENFDRQLTASRALREQAEREVVRKQSELDRVQRDYLAEHLSAATYEELRARLLREHEAAAAEAERHRHQEELVQEQGTIKDAEAETLRRLASIHEAIAGRMRDAAGVEALRAALATIFKHFTVVNVKKADGSDYLWVHPVLVLEEAQELLYPPDETAARSEAVAEAWRRRSRVPLRLEDRGPTC